MSGQVSLSVIFERALVTWINFVSVVVLDVSVQGHLALQRFAALEKNLIPIFNSKEEFISRQKINIYIKSSVFNAVIKEKIIQNIILRVKGGECSHF